MTTAGYGVEGLGVEEGEGQIKVLFTGSSLSDGELGVTLGKERDPPKPDSGKDKC